nr:hypothetical protein [Tanacetum cinerariifolium]
MSEIYESSLTAITPNSPITKSLIMEDEHLDTISEMESEEEKSLEFSGELAHIDLISSEIDETDFDRKEEIHLVEKLLYDNSSSRPSEEPNSENSNAIIESFSPSPIPIEELLSNDSSSLPKNESFHFDVPSSSRPPTKPPDDDGIYFDDESVMRILTVKVVDDISERCVLKPRILPTQPTLCPVIDPLLPFSSENKDKVHLLSHRGFKAF